MKNYWINIILSRLYAIRFESFLLSQLAILFGSLVVPSGVFESISPLIFYINILTGSFFLQNKENINYWKIVVVLTIIGGIFALSAFFRSNNQIFNYLKVIVLFIFHLLVTLNMIRQIWYARLVNKNIILGLMSGFISLGLIGFFICITIEIIHPGSFSGISQLDTANSITERLMYFSYITLMTIGYGDILPPTHIAQKATILIGLLGQFYIVIITALVVGKFINQTIMDKG